MPFKYFKKMILWKSYPLRLAALALVWLVLIAWLHHKLNIDHDQRKIVKMGYMPVITNLAAPLLDHASINVSSPVRFKALKFASFAEMAEALRNGEIQAAFIIAPLSIVLRQQGEDVKVVYIGNRHESTFVVQKSLHARSLKDLVGRTIAVPMRYSGHNLGVLRAIADAGLEGQIQIVEMNPPDMASALSAGSLDGYFVGEPFAAQTLRSGSADLLFYVEKIWPGFICNLLLVKQDFIDNESGVVRHLVEGAVRSGIWADKHQAQAAEIASQYWGQPKDLVNYALKTPKDRIVFDQYTPIEAELKLMAELMVRYDLLENADVTGLAFDRFAREADVTKIDGIDSILIAR